MWKDSTLIISFGNFFSGSRCGELARGTHGSKDSSMVWAPEAMWHYNVQGRSSATNGADQMRKKLTLGSRRVVRAGHRGITFVPDLALTNAAIMWQFVRPGKKQRFMTVSAPLQLTHVASNTCSTLCYRSSSLSWAEDTVTSRSRFASDAHHRCASHKCRAQTQQACCALPANGRRRWLSTSSLI